GNLARYDYGFLVASAILTWQTVTTHAAGASRRGLVAWAAPVALLAFGLSAPLVDIDNRVKTKQMIATRLRDTDELLRRTVPMQAEPPLASTYRRLQDAVPAGSRMLVMVDVPYLLDYGRNEIWNLDLPGTASPKPGIPCFQGPEAVVAYLRGLGIRHLLFVLPDKSAFLYPSDLWRPRLYDPDEIWRVYAPYVVDVTENLVALSKSKKHLHDEGGMVLLDLDAPAMAAR
ncbi:MAG: hypothetical protein JWM74_5751, partial [Myxococcaceae bacterium]|nr:hypothetical protein [Myxococcaceae bacterium]